MTEDRTFMILSRLKRPQAPVLLVPVCDASPRPVVGRDLDGDPVTGEDLDVVHPHLPRDVSQHLMPIVEFHAEHRVGQCLVHYAFYGDALLLCHSLSRALGPYGTASGAAVRAGGLRPATLHERQDVHTVARDRNRVLEVG